MAKKANIQLPPNHFQLRGAQQIPEDAKILDAAGVWVPVPDEDKFKPNNTKDFAWVEVQAQDGYFLQRAGKTKKGDRQAVTEIVGDAQVIRFVDIAEEGKPIVDFGHVFRPISRR